MKIDMFFAVIGPASTHLKDAESHRFPNAQADTRKTSHMPPPFSAAAWDPVQAVLVPFGCAPGRFDIQPEEKWLQVSKNQYIYIEREREKLIDIYRERETEIWSIENRQLATNGVHDWANRKTGSTHGTCASWLHDYWFKVQRSASRITKQTGFFMCLSLCTILQHFKQHTWTLEESTVAGGALSPWHHAQDQEHKGTSGPGTCINRPQKRHKAWFE